MTDLSARRAEIYAEIAARCTVDALPAPCEVSPKRDGYVWLRFDSYEEAERWATFLNLEIRVQIYQPEWNPNPVRDLQAGSGDWHGWRVYVTGWSEQVTT
ncbi:MAG TPA: hypothetical protein VFR23_25565 [Jiangellaceae bacterium]|nr:hypothetical protein [Jiangellaceae bacterium]